MNQEILDYIKSQRVGVLAIEMLDGSPHASAVHFAESAYPLVFFFETDKNYRKSEPLLGRNQSRASLVVGANENDAKTLQLDGVVELLKPEEMSIIDSLYLKKFPEKKEKSKGSDILFFKLTPNWWRYTDWKTPKGKIVLTSE